MHHHLILIREIDQQMSGSGCCGRIEGDATQWGQDECVFVERRERMMRVGEVYRAVRHTFGDEVQISIVDPRNFVSLIPLVVRDAFRFHVPALTALRAMASVSLTTGILDAQLLFRGTLPSPAEVVDSIAGRLEIDRVGASRSDAITAPPR
jgi:hypothetical protein